MRITHRLLLAGTLLCFISLKGYGLQGRHCFSIQRLANDNKDYLGDYTYTQGGQEMIMSVSEDKGNLILKISTEQNTVYSLKPVKDKPDQFEVTFEGKTAAGLTFNRDSNGKVASFTFEQGGGSYKWKKK